MPAYQLSLSRTFPSADCSTLDATQWHAVWHSFAPAIQTAQSVPNYSAHVTTIRHPVGKTIATAFIDPHSAAHNAAQQYAVKAAHVYAVQATDETPHRPTVTTPHSTAIDAAESRPVAAAHSPAIRTPFRAAVPNTLSPTQ